MSDDPARTRFWIIQAARLSGVLLVLGGMGVSQADWVRPGGAPVIGGALMIAGLIDLLLLPRMLARRWRTPE